MHTHTQNCIAFFLPSPMSIWPTLYECYCLLLMYFSSQRFKDVLDLILSCSDTTICILTHQPPFQKTFSILPSLSLSPPPKHFLFLFLKQFFSSNAALPYQLHFKKHLHSAVNLPIITCWSSIPQWLSSFLKHRCPCLPYSSLSPPFPSIALKCFFASYRGTFASKAGRSCPPLSRMSDVEEGSKRMWTEL